MAKKQEISNDEVLERITNFLRNEKRWGKNWQKRLEAIYSALGDEKSLAKSISVSQRRMKLFSKFFFKLVLDETIKNLARKTHRSKDDVVRWAAKKFLKQQRVSPGRKKE